MTLKVKLFALLVSIFFPFNVCAKIIKVCDDINTYPPFVFYHQNKISGINVDILNAALAGTEYKLAMELMPWNQCLKKVKDGDYDIVLSATFNFERSLYAEYSIPVSAVNIVMFYSTIRFPLKPIVRTIYDLKRAKICIVKKYNYDYLNEIEGSVIEKDISLSRVLERLHTNECDISPNSYEVIKGREYIGNLTLDNLNYFFIGEAPIKRDLYIIVSKKIKYKDFFQTLNMKLLKMSASGDMKRICERYLGRCF